MFFCSVLYDMLEIFGDGTDYEYAMYDDKVKSGLNIGSCRDIDCFDRKWKKYMNTNHN